MESLQMTGAQADASAPPYWFPLFIAEFFHQRAEESFAAAKADMDEGDTPMCAAHEEEFWKSYHECGTYLNHGSAAHAQ